MHYGFGHAQLLQMANTKVRQPNALVIYSALPVSLIYWQFCQVLSPSFLAGLICAGFAFSGWCVYWNFHIIHQRLRIWFRPFATKVAHLPQPYIFWFLLCWFQVPWSMLLNRMCSPNISDQYRRPCGGQLSPWQRLVMATSCRKRLLANSLQLWPR